MKRTWLLAGAGLAWSGVVSAQQAPEPDTTNHEAEHHEVAPADIVVTAPFQRTRQDVLTSVSVLSGTDLAREVRSTIGDTLARQPGVSSTSFGPNASRPVLRGFQGDRIRVLTDGIGSFDVSSTSADHAVAINPLTADRVEVLRGPAALQFGSSAIGGVVNVLDKRIPRRVPDEAAHLDATATYGSAADERSGGAAVDVAAGGPLVLHLDGSYLKTDDLEIGGHVLSKDLRAQARASADPDIRALADLKDRLPNSAARTWDVAGGASIITDGGNLGFSISRYDSLYGVPVRYSLDPDAEAEQVRLHVKQTRADARAEVDLGDGFFERLRGRFGWADYRHSEIDESGAVGTTFFNQGLEGRVELAQAKRGGWRGAVGGQLFIRDFDVVGEEKFVPKNSTVQGGVFTLQEFDLGAVKAEVGARYEHTNVDAAADPVIGNPDISRRFNAFSGSVGASVELVDDWRLGLNLSRTERAPSAEELFANGPHAGTQAFEAGDPTLIKEKSWGIEGVLRGQGDGYSLEASLFYNKFDDFIFEQPTGEVEDGLPVFQYLQAGARYYGFEAEGSLRLAELGGFTINADAVADYVRATVKDVGPAPRIPPLRVLGGLEAQGDAVNARIEAEWTSKQTRTAAFETETGGFTMVNASLSWKPFGTDTTTILLAANNIFDVNARRHASFLKDYAPLAGRDIRVTARVSF